MFNSLNFAKLIFLTKFFQIIKVIFAILLNKTSYYPSSVKLFEKNFKNKIKVKNSLMFSNATSAMEAALFSVGINSNSKVLSTAFVVPSSYIPAYCLGATLNFIDIDELTLNLDIKKLDNYKSVDVIIVTHFFGNPCQMDLILDWAKKNNIYVIEDCSHAHGASYLGRQLGSLGHIGIFSLQGAKAIAAGEGAIAVTNDSEIMIRMAAYGHQQAYKNFDISPNELIKNLPPFGFGRKMRVHPLGAILASEDLKRIELKNYIFSIWFRELKKISKNTKSFYLPKIMNNAKMGGYCQGVSLIFKNQKLAYDIKESLLKRKVNCFTRDYTFSILEYSKLYKSIQEVNEDLPNSTSLFSRVIFIPFYQFISPVRWYRLKSILTKI